MKQARIITSKIPHLPAAHPLGSYCASRFTYLTDNQWQKEITDGNITLNGITINDPAIKLQGGEMLSWNGSKITEPAVDDNIIVIYEDKWFAAVNKPGDLPVHPAGRYFHNTLVRIMENRYGRKVYPVHRIDRETSGVILLAFDGKSAGKLSESLARGLKVYLALVHGIFPPGEMIVDIPLGSDTESAVRKKRKAWPGGTEKAITRIQKVMTAGSISLVRCFPATGKLHQIRAHLLAAGFPIVGDKIYGRDETAFLTFIDHGLTAELAKSLILPRQALHAARLVFPHPHSRKEVILRAPLPEMFSECMRAAIAADSPFPQE